MHLLLVCILKIVGGRYKNKLFFHVSFWKLIDFMGCDHSEWAFYRKKILQHFNCILILVADFQHYPYLLIGIFDSMCYLIPCVAGGSSLQQYIWHEAFSTTDFILPNNPWGTPEDCGRAGAGLMLSTFVHPLLWLWHIWLLHSHEADVPSACALGQWDLSCVIQKLCGAIIA